jgi:hypothetical protein
VDLQGELLIRRRPQVLYSPKNVARL